MRVQVNTGGDKSIHGHRIAGRGGAKKRRLIKFISTQFQKTLSCFGSRFERLVVGARGDYAQHYRRHQNPEECPSHFAHGDTVAWVIRIGTLGASFSAGARLIASATSMPLRTRPNAENLPSKC